MALTLEETKIFKELKKRNVEIPKNAKKVKILVKQLFANFICNFNRLVNL